MKADVYKPISNSHPYVLDMWTVRSYEIRLDANHIHICYKCEQSEWMKSHMYKPNPNRIHMHHTCEQSDNMKLAIYKPDPNHIHICYKYEQSYQIKLYLNRPDPNHIFCVTNVNGNSFFIIWGMTQNMHNIVHSCKLIKSQCAVWTENKMKRRFQVLKYHMQNCSVNSPNRFVLPVCASQCWAHRTSRSTVGTKRESINQHRNELNSSESSSIKLKPQQPDIH